MTNYRTPAPQLTAAEEAQLMQVFHTWYELFTAGDPDLSDQAAELFRAQTDRGGAWRAAWIRVQDTLSNWWDLPEGMRDFLRAAPLRDGFDSRALRTVVALADDDEN